MGKNKIILILLAILLSFNFLEGAQVFYKVNRVDSLEEEEIESNSIISEETLPEPSNTNIRIASVPLNNYKPLVYWHGMGKK